MRRHYRRLRESYFEFRSETVVFIEIKNKVIDIMVWDD